MRNGLQVLKDKNQKGMVGVEIGVWRGENAANMLQNLNIKKLYLVDCYKYYPEYNLKEISGHTNMENNLRDAKAILRPYIDKIEWVIKTAHEAKDDIPDELDFVYIDGNHSAEACKLDMDDYWPKVRSGGFFSGHDIWKPHLLAVVKKFAEDRGYVHNQYNKPDNQTWDQAGIDLMDWWYFKR